MSIARILPTSDQSGAALPPGRAQKGKHMRNTLRTMREKKGWTQRELAAKAKCSRAYIIGLEGGGTPSLQVAFRLARIFNKPVEEIFLPDWIKLPEPQPAQATA